MPVMINSGRRVMPTAIPVIWFFVVAPEGAATKAIAGMAHFYRIIDFLKPTAYVPMVNIAQPDQVDNPAVSGVIMIDGRRACMRGVFVWKVWAIVLAWLVPLAGVNAAYTFSIVPQQSATKTALIWGPVLKYLEERTGEDFRLVTARDIPAFEQSLREGLADFSYMSPYHYTVFHETQGYRALVRARDQVIKGIVVVPKDSPLRDIHELAGRTLAFTRNAFAATLPPIEGRYGDFALIVVGGRWPFKR